MQVTITDNSIEAIIAGCKLRSRECFSELYDRYSNALMGVIFRITNDTELSEDLLQDTFIRIWRSIETFDAAKGSFFTWAVRIARNTVTDYFRSKNYKNQQIQKPVLYEVYHERLVEKDTEQQKMLHNIVLKLDPAYRQIIDLVYIWGFTQEEVSKMLDMPLGTVKTKARTAIQQLRKIAGQL